MKTTTFLISAASLALVHGQDCLQLVPCLKSAEADLGCNSSDDSCFCNPLFQSTSEVCLNTRGCTPLEDIPILRDSYDIRCGATTSSTSDPATSTDSLLPDPTTTSTDSLMPTITDSLMPTSTDSVLPTLTDSLLPPTETSPGTTATSAASKTEASASSSTEPTSSSKASSSSAATGTGKATSSPYTTEAEKSTATPCPTDTKETKKVTDKVTATPCTTEVEKVTVSPCPSETPKGGASVPACESCHEQAKTWATTIVKTPSGSPGSPTPIAHPTESSHGSEPTAPVVVTAGAGKAVWSVGGVLVAVFFALY